MLRAADPHNHSGDWAAPGSLPPMVMIVHPTHNLSVLNKPEVRRTKRPELRETTGVQLPSPEHSLGLDRNLMSPDHHLHKSPK